MRLDLPFPKLNDFALHGILGRTAAKLSLYSESSTVAILAHLLVGVGNLIGRGPYFALGLEEHHTNLYVAIVGDTSLARKGTAWHGAEWLLQQVNPYWSDNCIVRGGITTGQGLLWRIRDRQGRDLGVEDKRLLPVEEELSKLLRLNSDKTSTTTGTLRYLWDSPPRYDHRTKKDYFAVSLPHVSFIGHITSFELLPLLTQTEIYNGVANRFLWFVIQRDKLISNPQIITADMFKPEIDEIKKRVDFARGVRSKLFGERKDGVGLMQRSKAGQKLWDEVYNKGELEGGFEDKLGPFAVRGPAQVIRLAMLYALMDGKVVVEPEHIQAAIAIWDYCRASAKYIFSKPTLNKKQLKTLELLQRGRLTRTQVNNKVYGNNEDKPVIDADIDQLKREGHIREKKEQGVVWYELNHNAANS